MAIPKLTFVNTMEKSPNRSNQCGYTSSGKQFERTNAHPEWRKAIWLTIV